MSMIILHGLRELRKIPNKRAKGVARTSRIKGSLQHLLGGHPRQLLLRGQHDP